MTDRLEDLYATLRTGTTVKSFLEKRANIFEFIRTQGLAEDYRLGKGRLKQLRDEVTPVARFIRTQHAGPNDQIRFALGNTAPDCIISRSDGSTLQIEVTVARARERCALMEKLNEVGEIHGLIDLVDDAPLQQFRERAEENADPNKAQAYSAEMAIDLIADSVKHRAERKVGHQADILLIEIVPDMYALSGRRWDELRAELVKNPTIRNLVFGDVYLTGYGESGDLCLKIK